MHAQSSFGYKIAPHNINKSTLGQKERKPIETIINLIWGTQKQTDTRPSSGQKQTQHKYKTLRLWVTKNANRKGRSDNMHACMRRMHACIAGMHRMHAIKRTTYAYYASPAKACGFCHALIDIFGALGSTF